MVDGSWFMVHERSEHSWTRNRSSAINHEPCALSRSAAALRASASSGSCTGTGCSPPGGCRSPGCPLLPRGVLQQALGGPEVLGGLAQVHLHVGVPRPGLLEVPQALVVELAALARSGLAGAGAGAGVAVAPGSAWASGSAARSARASESESAWAARPARASESESAWAARPAWVSGSGSAWAARSARASESGSAWAALPARASGRGRRGPLDRRGRRRRHRRGPVGRRGLVGLHPAGGCALVKWRRPAALGALQSCSGSGSSTLRSLSQPSSLPARHGARPGAWWIPPGPSGRPRACR